MTKISDVIIAKCEEAGGLPEGSLKGKSREADIVKVRHIAAHMARHIGGLTFKEISTALNQATHVSAIYSCKRVESSTDVNSDLYDIFEPELTYIYEKISQDISAMVTEARKSWKRSQPADMQLNESDSD